MRIPLATQKTVMLTGASGYIAKHIIVKLLNAGYDVVGSVRALGRSDEVVQAVTAHLDSTDDLDKRLRFAALDLSRDEGWTEALAGADFLMHTASPFPLEQPKDEDEVIRPAVDGALRALRAAKAAGIKRVILTSSAVAVMDSTLKAGKTAYDEDDWSDLDHPASTPYGKSKTLAERAAWDFVRDEAPEIALTTINPVIVVGPPLDKNFGTSVSVVQRLLRAKDPMIPKFGFPLVDARDVAEMHLRALQTPASAGQRILAVEKFLWFMDVAKLLKAHFPNRKIVTLAAPNFVMRLLAIFDQTVRQIVPILGKNIQMSNDRARDVLNMEFIPAADSLIETAEFLIENDAVD